MKTLTNYSAIVMLLIAFLGATTTTAQEWSTEQKTVWQEIDNMWAKWKVGDIDAAFANVHEDYLGWNKKAPMPTSKEKWLNGMKDYMVTVSDQYYDIEPARIVIYKNVAVVHYYYNYSYSKNEEDKKVKHSYSGKWTAFFVLEKSLWFLIGDFTYSEPKM